MHILKGVASTITTNAAKTEDHEAWGGRECFLHTLIGANLPVAAPIGRGRSVHILARRSGMGYTICFGAYALYSCSLAFSRQYHVRQALASQEGMLSSCLAIEMEIPLGHG